MKGYRVLLVDDSASMRRAVRKVLAQSGLPIDQVIEAEHGVAALDVLRASWVDVVLTDLHMPIMDGIALLRAMRASPGLRSVPAMVLSSDGSSPRRHEAELLGVVEYLVKPLRPETVRNALGRVLGVST